MEQREVTLADGQSLNVWHAAGPPGAPALFLVHGLGVTGWLNWGQCFDALSRHFRVVCFDLRGHGRGLRTLRFRLEQCADDVVAVADALGVEEFIVAGYSMGGPIAKLCWRRHPGRVRGLVLAATAAKFMHRLNPRRVGRALGVADSLIMINPRWVKRRILQWANYRLGTLITEDELERELRGHRLSILLQAAGALARFSAEAWVSEIDVPVAVVVTSQDDRVPPQRQRELAAAIPDATVIETPGTHTTVILEGAVFGEAMVRACRAVQERIRSEAISA